jgi:hypothetical protein
VVVTRQRGGSSKAGADVLTFGAGLLCGIGEGQKRAAYRVGCGGDTSPLGGFQGVNAGAVDLTNPQSLNRYAYVMNNPANWIDQISGWSSTRRNRRMALLSHCWENRLSALVLIR